MLLEEETSVSRVWLKYGCPKIVVNGKPLDKYFLRKIYSSILEAPLVKTENLDKVEIFSTVSGGGLSGQAGAIRHRISRALVNLDPTLRKKLKKMGFLTRDARKVERKKFGKHKARRSPQFSKKIDNVIKRLYFWVSGYTGSKLLYYLCNHKKVKIVGVFGYKTAGSKLECLFPKINNLPKISITNYEKFDFKNVDLIFSCLPHGEFQKKYLKILIKKISIVDLSGDFRLESKNEYREIL